MANCENSIKTPNDAQSKTSNSLNRLGWITIIVTAIGILPNLVGQERWNNFVKSGSESYNLTGNWIMFPEEIECIDSQGEDDPVCSKDFGEENYALSLEHNDILTGEISADNIPCFKLKLEGSVNDDYVEWTATSVSDSDVSDSECTGCPTMRFKYGGTIKNQNELSIQFVLENNRDLVNYKHCYVVERGSFDVERN